MGSDRRTWMCRLRDRDFVRACAAERCRRLVMGGDTGWDSIVRHVLEGDAPCYYVEFHTVDNYMSITRRHGMPAGTGMGARRLRDIVGAVRALVDKGMEPRLAIGRVVNSRAPRYYITAATGRRILRDRRRMLYEMMDRQKGSYGNIC